MEVATFVYLDADVDDIYIKMIVENIKMIQDFADIRADVFVEKDVSGQIANENGIFPYFQNRKFHDRYCLQICGLWGECTAFYAKRFKEGQPNVLDYCPYGLHVLTAGIEINGKVRGVVASEAFLTEAVAPTKELLEENTQLKRKMVPHLPNHHLTRLKTFYDILGRQLENALSIGLLKEQLETEKQSHLNFVNTMNVIVPRNKEQNITETAQENPLPKTSELVENAVDYINRNYLNKIHLEDVAKVIHANPQYLSRIFKKEVGVSFVDYLNILRVKYACNLLTETRYPIYRVALECGFSDAPYFTRVFHKVMNVLPSDFRKNDK